MVAKTYHVDGSPSGGDTMTGFGPYPGSAPMQPVARRIPDDQPFVVRLNVFRLGLAWAVAWVVVVGLETLLIADFLVPAAIGTAAGALILLIYLAISARRGPILAVGPQGVWVSRREGGVSGLGSRFTAVFLPWSSIERIYVRRVLLDKRVCVRAAGWPTVFRLDLFDILRSLYGTPFHASLTFADRPADEVVAAIAQHSGGTTKVDL
jgi:hypothetical protein